MSTLLHRVAGHVTLAIAGSAFMIGCAGSPPDGAEDDQDGDTSATAASEVVKVEGESCILGTSLVKRTQPVPRSSDPKSTWVAASTHVLYRGRGTPIQLNHDASRSNVKVLTAEGVGGFAAAPSTWCYAPASRQIHWLKDKIWVIDEDRHLRAGEKIEVRYYYAIENSRSPGPNP